MKLSPELEDCAPTDITETRLGSNWDSEAIVKLIRRNTTRGYMPSMLLLGRREAGLLRGHLSQAFREEELAQLNELHYAGLKVVETQLESLVKVAGEKMLPEVQRAMRHMPAWKEESESRWRFDAQVG